MIHPKFLRALAVAAAFWVGAYFLLTLTVDPYGVSPLKMAVDRVNVFKPKRVDIDRLIKPYEVWRHQPRTVFLGTSRIHQAMDPAILDGSRFAPAYNASIPASSLGLNVSHLRQYIELNPNLKVVFVELFLYNFLGQPQERQLKTRAEFVRESAGLFFSNDVLWASVLTFAYNLGINKPSFEIKPGGYYFYKPGHDATGPFSGFPAGIWPLHETRTSGMKLHEPAFESLREIAKIAQEKKLELVFVLTPNHAYDDYYIDDVGAWDKVEEWLRRLSEEPITIYSFSQPNPWVYEPVRKPMLFWNDPYHFSLEMGNAMQSALAGQINPGAPANFMMRMTPQSVALHIASRRAAIREWALDNPAFVVAFQEEKRRWESRKAAGSGGDLVPMGLVVLASLQKQLTKLHPGTTIMEYRIVSDELAATKDVPAHLVKDGRIENPWGGRLVAQIFPANAWGPGVPATYNFFFEAVPKIDCARLVATLGRNDKGKIFRINLEPSGTVHSRFPVSGADGCSDGGNTVGYTVIAE